MGKSSHKNCLPAPSFIAVPHDYVHDVSMLDSRLGESKQRYDESQKYMTCSHLFTFIWKELAGIKLKFGPFIFMASCEISLSILNVFLQTPSNPHA